MKFINALDCQIDIEIRCMQWLYVLNVRYINMSHVLMLLQKLQVYQMYDEVNNTLAFGLLMGHRSHLQ